MHHVHMYKIHNLLQYGVTVISVLFMLQISAQPLKYPIIQPIALQAVHLNVLKPLQLIVLHILYFHLDVGQGIIVR